MNVLNFNKSQRLNIPSSYYLYDWGDTHIGNPGVSYPAIKEFVRKVKSKKNTFWGHNGDAVEAVLIGDKRWEMDVHSGRYARIMDQINEFCDLFEPIADRCLYVLEGNHEFKLHNFIKVTDEICKRFGLEEQSTVMPDGQKNYSTYSAKLIMNDIKGLAWHGHGVISPKAGDKKQQETNKQIAVKRKLRVIGGVDDANWAAMGHVHQVIRCPPDTDSLHMVDDGISLHECYPKPGRIYIDDNRNLYRIPEEDKWYLATGSALRSYMNGVSGYAERSGYPASEIGCIEIIVQNDSVSNCGKSMLGSEANESTKSENIHVRKVAEVKKKKMNWL